MRRRPFFRSHLYNQIVVPLLAASVMVGILATVVAVYFLQDLTNRWVTEYAIGSAANLSDEYEEHIFESERVARFAATSQRLEHMLDKGDLNSVRALIAGQRATFGFDEVLILDSDGVVMASSGSTGFKQRETPFGTRPDVVMRGSTRLMELGGKPSVSTIQPILTSEGRYAFVGVEYVDEDFLARLSGAAKDTVCFYDADGQLVACVAGEQVSPEVAAPLRVEVMRPNEAIARALVSSAAEGAGSASFEAAGSQYQVAIERVELPGDEGRGRFGHIAGVVSQDVSRDAGRTTTRLITMWSIVAVVSLVGLGLWVARRVSDPLVELSDGARRIADGDFSTKVEVTGTNEIAELASTFNQMTDSLSERSDSLTKKILELATLYEMSRALGSTLDMEELLGSVLESALRIFDLDLGYVSLRDKDTGALSVRALRGVGGATTTDGAVRSSMSDWVVREGRPLIFNPDPGSASQTDSIIGARASLCVPLVSAEGTIGAITIGSSDSEYRFVSDDVRLLSTIANHVTIAVGNIELFSSLQEAYLATVRSLAAAVDAKDTFTRGHSDRVAMYSVQIAERMGLSHEQRIALEMAAYLHDIGKIGVREDILLKPGQLDDAEMIQMRHHPLIGANILKPVAFPWAITPVVRHHHEHFDGTGYPAGLRGDEIPLLARILTVADSYEAMTADRPYRRGRSSAEAVSELKSCSGTQFDPRIVEYMIEVLTVEDDAVVAVTTEERSAVVGVDEARAIFSALVDGVFASFRRLGGPRLAANVEAEVDEQFVAEDLPFRVDRGRLSFTREASDDSAREIEGMRGALRRIDSVIARLSGTTLVDHFYDEAIDGLSARMIALARELDFYRG